MQAWTQVSEEQFVLALSAGLIVFAGAIIVLLRWFRKDGSRQARRELQNFSHDEVAATPRAALAPLGMLDSSALQDRGITKHALSGDHAVSEPVAASPPALGLQQDHPPGADELDARARCDGLLALARNQLQSDAVPAAAASLREAIVLAAAHGLPDQQALARLELGEIARQNGDLITACEHWQIARGLFHDLKNKGRVMAIEARMREHGCPTDWVLNDF